MSVAAAKNDIPAELLADMRKQTLYPELLDDLVACSRENFGWFTKHSLRSIEYPWIVAQSKDLGPKMLDVGAGVSPLPIYLTERCGKQVTTVDYNEVIVKRERVASNNEWGYLDYSQFDKRISSFNKNIADFSDDASYDIIYSVSVIEHMPADIRRMMWGVFDRLAKKKASILLTIDLYGRSLDLWNFDRGVECEPIAVHGTMGDMINELGAHGFELKFVETLRRAPVGKPGDLAMLHFQR